MLGIHSMIPIFAIAGLSCALAYVAQPPITLTQSSTALTAGDNTTAASLNSSSLSPLQEDAPLAFKIEYIWKNQGGGTAAPGTTFDRYRFYKTMLEAMSALCGASWNAYMDGVLFRSTYGIAIRFVHDKTGSGLRTKYVVWALEEVFDILVEQNRYETGTIAVNLDWDKQRVAFGSITTITGNAVLDAINDGNLNSTLSLPKPLQNSPSLEPLPVLQPQQPAVNLSADADVTCHYEYRENGAVFQDFQIYNASLKWMIQIAPIEDQQRPIRFPISTYNDMNDFTLSLRPVDYIKQITLTYNIASQILAYLAAYAEKPQELSGLVFYQGMPTGVVCIDKGDRRGWAAADLCQPPEDNAVAGPDQVATA